MSSGIQNVDAKEFATAESCYDGPACNENPPVTEAILKSLEKFCFTFYIGNNRNLSITDQNGWSLEIR